ncbi:MAG TPA: hypothetical protein VMD56_12580 [Steroidobacteraceae bacterium]|nr:hypothetical protein [Steroidobacteraceae bacterium]
MPAGADLVRDLRAGGYVLVMRHAQSPDARPDGSDAEPDNAAHERQLSAAGKAQARALGAALRKLAQAGEMILFKPAKGGAAASVVARITIAQWRQWASRAAR